MQCSAVQCSAVLFNNTLSISATVHTKQNKVSVSHQGPDETQSWKNEETSYSQAAYSRETKFNPNRVKLATPLLTLNLYKPMSMHKRTNSQNCEFYVL